MAKQSNLRTLKSRNQREGWYCNKRLIEGCRADTFHVLHNKRTKIKGWSLCGKEKNLLGENDE